jgi:ABC-type nickel/cobalt efflux system permease component RcnA
MLWTLLIVAIVHVLPAVFWAGATFVLARVEGTGAEHLAYPQLGAAAFATVSGATLWGLLSALPVSARWKFPADPCQTARSVEQAMAISD